jgi:hypothetical protein
MSGPAAQLHAAGKAYSACAKQVELKLVTPSQPTVDESELLIAFGIASDWCRRAAILKPITYLGRKMNKSKRSPGLMELVRFNFAWSGMNALFSRESVRALLGSTNAKSELDRFQFLFSHAQPPSASVSAWVKVLHAILNTQVTTRIAGVSLAPVMTLESIFLKYTTPEIRRRKTGKLIQSAISTGNLSALNLPILIYQMRNWSVHGALLDSAFRNEARFKAYIDTVLAALSDVHANISQVFLQKL